MALSARRMEPIKDAALSEELNWLKIRQAEQTGNLDSLNATPIVDKETTIAVIPDLHIPYHDNDLLEKALAVSKGKDVIVMLGDLIDAYTVSDFSKDPARKSTLQDEVDQATVLLARIRRENPTAEIHFIAGNHEERIARYIINNAPAFSDMRELKLPVLLKLDEQNIEYHARSGFNKWGCRFKHGDLVRGKSGYTARGEMEAHRCSGFSGHTHRLGRAIATDKEGVTTEWWEAGHLCDTRAAEYVDSPDWQAGMLALSVTDKSVKVTPIEFQL